MIFIFAIIILLEIVSYLILADIILSWLQMLWLKIRINFISSILEPIYSFIRKYIPTSLWPIDFTPMIVIFALLFLKWLIIWFFPESQSILKSL